VPGPSNGTHMSGTQTRYWRCSTVRETGATFCEKDLDISPLGETRLQATGQRGERKRYFRRLTRAVNCRDD